MTILPQVFCLLYTVLIFLSSIRNGLKGEKDLNSNFYVNISKRKTKLKIFYS